ncbi:hypothetical protein Tco_1406053 [Tanacetum coccineum]
MKVKESLNVTFDESPPPTKLSPLVDDDVGEEEAIKKNTKVVNNNNEEDESIEVDEIVNIKESKNHPLDQVIGNLNHRTLRSQAQNHSNFFCFISTIEPKDVKEALKEESWVVAMQEELNQLVANDVWELVPLPMIQSSSRVPVPLLEDPYEAIRQDYLDGTDIESDPFEDPIDTETPELPLTVAPPISLSESTPPMLVPILRRTARMAVRVPPGMSLSLFSSIAEVTSMSESAFRKRFRSSYESSPSVSPPDLPLRKHYRGASKLVEDSGEDEEIEESLDSDSVGEDTKDEGSTAEDEDPAVRDEGLAAGVEGPDMDDESHGLDDESHVMDDEGRGLGKEGHSVESDGLGLEEEEEAVPRGQQQAALVVRTVVSAPLGLGYGALRCRELALEEDDVYDTPSPKWTFGSLSISPSPSVVPSPVSSPMILLTAPSPIASLATVETEGFLTELGAQVEMQRGLIRDHAVRLEKSLKYEQEWVAVTFGAIWRPMLAMESWAGQTDAHRADLWHAISDMQGENQDLRLQLVEERCARLELAEVVDSMRRGKEPRGSQRAGKAPMIIEETPKKSKEQILQEEANLAEAIRLDTL